MRMDYLEKSDKGINLEFFELIRSSLSGQIEKKSYFSVQF